MYIYYKRTGQSRLFFSSLSLFYSLYKYIYIYSNITYIYKDRERERESL